LANQIDLERALDAADRAFASWRKTSAYGRSTIMRKAADLVRERKNQIAIVLSQEQGKPFVEAQAEVAGTADVIDWMAEEGRRAYGRIIPARDADVRQMVVSEPVGIVAAFSPWNFPTYTPVRKIAGALAAGCSIILKPAEETPGSAIELARCFHDAALPRGVLNLVFGVPDLVSRLLIEAPAIKKISFTGSVPVGKRLAELAARGMKRATMELGGHSPVIVLEDADPERAADFIAPFKFRNAGQVCVAPNRFFVHAGIGAK
jgi:succinate-semialdehyde dehydrogenase/glutarate-semialdehyde dehydrogenase